ncbi:accessory Sec system protein Asp2 [Streptococcus suis]|uniref:accessory Sec system protein Asp2 n=1 Tax=Streptococcus suis TaxID=1307 RepID=UPI0003FD1C31|nr:accessory Sec system protein Asp2 [Streptococcus suis]MCK3936670.1 accessory Sec system protein Asp2 [Streptococcus suis]NQP17437.1 accessory Sec system protein Asp2 [Streptococcus suis]HEM3182164.1 accessory Sec system protein Asp2 [Streptococcus suis 89-5259]
MAKKIPILQIGGQNWQTEQSLSDKLEWHYYSFERIEELLSELDQIQSEQIQLKTLRQEREEVLTTLFDEELDEQAKVELEEFLRTSKSFKELEKEIKRLQKKIDTSLKFSALVLSDDTYPESIMPILDLFKVYEIFYPQGSHATGWLQEELRKRMAQSYDATKKSEFAHTLSQGLFVGQYGAKVHIDDLEVSPNFAGSIQMKGRKKLILEGEFEHDYRQIAFFRFNVQYNADQFLNLFLEHETSSECSLQMSVRLIPDGATDHIVKEWKIEGEELRNQVVIDAEISGYLFISILAKGSGRVEIGDLHYRFSRNGLGEFILGGERIVDENLQEVFTYFEPADFKPPLCVYFSGFRTAEGFEGFWMMKSMKTPFMLICDPRLDGGAFYLGSKELEDKIQQKIQDKLDFLGFDSSQLILSGMSMGTFGASYYGAKLKPHGIVVSKPLLSLGDMALAEHLNRPGGFPTSLDLLHSNYHSMDTEAAEKLNNRFWDLMEPNVYESTKFAVAYMKEDDYDSTAFEKLVRTSRETGARILGRGYSGRHLDGSDVTSSWFIKQYRDMLKKDFNRE